MAGPSARDTGPIGTGIAHRDRIEPPSAVLETAGLPLDHRHIWWCVSHGQRTAVPVRPPAVPAGMTRARRRGRIRTCNIRFQRPSCCQIAPPAYMPVCASTHSLDATRRPGCDGHLPPLRPPANACCATTGWMPRGPATWVRCPSCPSRPTGGVPCVPARDSNLDLHPQRAACCHYTNRPLTPQSNRV